MKKEEAIRLAGSATKLAKIFEISPSAVGQWGEELSKERALQLKALKPGWFRKKKAPKVPAMSALFG